MDTDSLAADFFYILSQSLFISFALIGLIVRGFLFYFRFSFLWTL